MKYLQQIKNHLPEIAFVALTVRTLTLGAGIGEALVLISLVLSAGYKLWIDKEKVTERDELNQKLSNITATLETLTNANLEVRLNDAVTKLDNMASAVQLRNTRNEPQNAPAGPSLVNGTKKKYF